MTIKFYFNNEFEYFNFFVTFESNSQKPAELDQFFDHYEINDTIKKTFKKIAQKGELDPHYANIHINTTKALMSLLKKSRVFFPITTNFLLNRLPQKEVEISYPLVYSLSNEQINIIHDGVEYPVISDNIAFLNNQVYIFTDTKLLITSKAAYNNKVSSLLSSPEINIKNIVQQIQNKGLGADFILQTKMFANDYKKTLSYEKKSFKLIATVSFGCIHNDQIWDEPYTPISIHHKDTRYSRNEIQEQLFLKEMQLNGFYKTGVNWTFNGRFPEKSLQNLESLGWKIYQSDGQEAEVIVPTKFINGLITLNIVSKQDWFDIQGFVSFEKEVIPLKDLIKSAQENKPIPLKNNQKGLLSITELQKLEFILPHIEMQNEEITIPFNKIGLISKTLRNNKDIEFDDNTKVLVEKVSNFLKIEAQPVPKGFQLSLRDYQKDGLSWLVFLNELKLGGILADDMGLGKTAQILAYVQWLKNKYKKIRVLVIVPKSLLFNWSDEIQKFTPDLNHIIYHGTNRKKEDLKTKNAILITTYHTLRNDNSDLIENLYDLIVLDESQAIKNHTTAIYKAVKTLNAKQKICMTGTPVENHLGELWSQFNFLMPGLLKSYNHFHNYYISNPMPTSAEQLKSFIYPFILRRKKEEVAKELPPKMEQIIYCDMHPSQQTYYNQLKDSVRNEIFSVVGENKSGKSKLHILEGLLRLRQAACHPCLIAKKKATYTSGKLESLIAMVTEIMDEGHKVLIFSQFTSMLALIKDKLIENNLNYFYLDGSTNNRKQIVDDFQTTGSASAFLISLKAGGVGLNLTAAGYVFIFDPWWNPAVENQAIDRAYRIGQDKKVFAYRMITKGTIEEKILKLQTAKKTLADDVLNNEKSLMQSLTSDDLEFLLT